MSENSKKNYLAPFDWKGLFISRGLPIIGVDEVGRGCLAGPVVAGACYLKSDELIGEMTDSKLLSESRRESLAPKISATHAIRIAHADLEEIYKLNILGASLLAMSRAVSELAESLNFSKAIVLVDGNQRIPGLPSDLEQILVIKGDLRASPISAASIVAKVFRDQWMRDLAKDFPVYGFEKNKGYGSEAHRQKIAEFGPTPWHRRDFSGVREYWPL